MIHRESEEAKAIRARIGQLADKVEASGVEVPQEWRDGTACLPPWRRIYKLPVVGRVSVDVWKLQNACIFVAFCVVVATVINWL